MSQAAYHLHEFIKVQVIMFCLVCAASDDDEALLLTTFDFSFEKKKKKINTTTMFTPRLKWRESIASKPPRASTVSMCAAQCCERKVKEMRDVMKLCGSLVI